MFGCSLEAFTALCLCEFLNCILCFFYIIIRLFLSDFYFIFIRFVAEVQYQLGLALGHLNRLPEAEAAVGEAISVLHTKKEGLLKESPSEARDKELAELETLIADIGEAKKGLPDLVAGSSHGTGGTDGFTKAIDGKAASTIGIKRAAEENFVELAKKGRVEGPAMA